MSIEVLAKRIEEAYEALDKTIEKVGLLTGIVDQFRINTESIMEKYITTLDPSRMAEMRESSKKNLQKMVEDIDSIDKALKNYEVVEYQLVEQITNFQQRINNLENNLQNTRKSLQDMDTKLLRLIKEAEKNQQSAQKRFSQASQLIAAEKEIEKYDELIKLMRINNRLLQEVANKQKGMDISGQTKGLNNDHKNQKNGSKE